MSENSLSSKPTGLAKDIPPEKEQDLQTTYGKGAKMLMGMGLKAEHLKNAPIDTPLKVGRQGLGFQQEATKPSTGKSHNKTAIINRYFEEPEQNFSCEGSSKTEASKPELTRKGRGYNHQVSYKGQKKLLNEKQSCAQPADEFPGSLIEAFGKLVIVTKDEENKSADDFRCVKENINVMVENCDKKLKANEAKIRSADKELVVLKNMESELSQKIDDQYKSLQELEKLRNVISSGYEDPPPIDNKQRIEEYSQVFKSIKENELVWERMGFYKYVAPLIIPLLKQEIGPNWNPLKETYKPAPLYVPWNNILRDKPQEFEKIVQETFMPPFVKAIRKWDGCNPQQIYRLLKVWALLFPQSMITDIKNEAWLKFIEVISNWDPVDQNPDNFITPNWLRNLKKLVEPKFPEAIQNVCDRIIVGLGKWHPNNDWAVKTISLWGKTFTDRQMSQIMHIVAIKLEANLEKIDFKASNAEAVDAVFLWSNILASKKFYDILERAFFPNWYSFLKGMVDSDNSFEDLRTYYTFWRNRFPEFVWEESCIREQFHKALHLLNSALIDKQLNELTADLSLKESTSKPRNTQQSGTSQANSDLLDAKTFLDMTPATFRDLLQKKCEDRGIIFYPIPKLYKDGKQIYRCKDDSVYVDSGVIYVKRAFWVPISMNDLLANDSHS